MSKPQYAILRFAKYKGPETVSYTHLDVYKRQHIEQMPAFQYAKKQLCDTASLLERKASIPQIKAKLPMLQEIHTDAFWDANDILLFERVRKELRELIRFLDEGGGAQRQIVTKLTDPIIDSQEGVQLEAAYDLSLIHI